MHKYTLLPLLLVCLFAISTPLRADCNRPSTVEERRDCANEFERDIRRGTTDGDKALKRFQENAEKDIENMRRQDEEERARNATQRPKSPLSLNPNQRTEYGPETKLRIEREKYESYRDIQLRRLNEKLASYNLTLGKQGASPESHYRAVSTLAPFHGAMATWAEQGYKRFPDELASLYGFVVASDPCADNPNQIGFPISDQLNRSNIFYQNINRHPQCIYGRMYRAIPFLLQAGKSKFAPFHALACAQIDAWIARHFESGSPVQEPRYFKGAVYNIGDFKFLSDKLAQCKEGMRHAQAFEAGLFQPARQWVKATGNYFSDVRLIRFYDRKIWDGIENMDDAGSIRAIFNDVMKDYADITAAFPESFSQAVDGNGNGGHAYR